MSMHVIRLGFATPPLTSNGQRRAHWTTVRRAKVEVETDVYWRAKVAQITVTPPVEVFLTWYAPDARIRDSDCLSVMLKGCLDAIVAANIGLPGDDHRYVTRSGSSVVVDRADPRIELTIVECEQPKDAA
jgi:hypothetical protein